MVTQKIGRFRVVGSNNFYVIGRWDGYSYQVMNNVPSYSTLRGAMKKAKELYSKDISTRIPAKRKTKTKSCNPLPTNPFNF